MKTLITKIKKLSLNNYVALVFIFAVSAFSGYAQCVKLIWSDEFNGNELDTTKWSYDIGDGCPNLCNWGNGELQYYRSENASFTDSSLLITAKKEDYGKSNYTSAKIKTKNLADWTYGRFEARMKLPKGQGMWPAFWMLSADNKYGGWPNSGEIDIMESLGHEPDKIYGSVHFGPPYNHYTEPYTLSTGDFSDAFHIFAFEWTKDTLSWYVDGNLYSQKTRTQIDPWLPFDEKFYLILNLAVGGSLPGTPDSSTVFPQSMEVDYVRVYGSPSMQKIVSKGDVVKNAKNIRYSIADFPSAGYDWKVPADASIVSGQGTSSILVDLGCTEGDISVNIGTDCDTAEQTIPIAFIPLKISGETAIFASDTSLIYKIPALHNTSLSWIVPEGVSIASISQDSSMIKLNWGCKAGTIVLDLSNSCESTQLSLPVTLKLAEMQGLETVAENAQNISYSISALPFAQTYKWSVPDDATITDGQGTNAISVNFGVNPGNIMVEIPTFCDTNIYSLPVLTGDEFLYCSFEGSNLLFLPFSGSMFERIINPFPEGINHSQHVGKTFKSTTAWAGIYADLNAPFNFSVYHTLKMKVYGPKAGVIKMKLEENGTNFIEKDANYTNINKWQEMSFNFAGAASDIFKRLTLFFDFGSADANYFYFDDIILTAEAVSPTSLKELDNNSLFVYPVPTGNTLYLKNLEKINKLVISDISGRELKVTKVNNRSDISIDMSGYKPGLYVLKAFSLSGKSQILKIIKE